VRPSVKKVEVTIDLKIIKPEIIEINQRNRSKGTVLKYMVYIIILQNKPDSERIG